MAGGGGDSTPGRISPRSRSHACATQQRGGAVARPRSAATGLYWFAAGARARTASFERLILVGSVVVRRWSSFGGSSSGWSPDLKARIRVTCRGKLREIFWTSIPPDKMAFDVKFPSGGVVRRAARARGGAGRTRWGQGDMVRARRVVGTGSFRRTQVRARGDAGWSLIRLSTRA